MRSIVFYSSILLVVGLATAAFTGCQRNDSGSQATDENHSANDEHAADEHGDAAHGHAAGAHGGTMVSVGQDNYHLEAVITSEGKLRLYMLGRDETRVQDVEAQELTAFAKPENGEAVQFTITPEPQAGDGDGKTSAFAGQLPDELKGKSLQITIPALRIGEERFRVGFSLEGDDHADEQHTAAPPKVTDEKERELYLTPGGAYTQADIIANGNQTASQKFAGFDSQHNLEPQVGDRICPVTLTKANPECTWIVGGKEYQFCCPPCVDEFVALAKSGSADLKDPEEYVKR